MLNQARPLADFLCGEERFEDAASFRDPATGIADGDTFHLS
jgi:hypothetical protein